MDPCVGPGLIRNAFLRHALAVLTCAAPILCADNADERTVTILGRLYSFDKS